MKFSLKRENTLFWSTDHSLQEVEGKLSSGEIDGQWLICPLGEAEQAVSVSEFLEQPSMFETKPAAAAAAPPPMPRATISEPPGKRYHDFDALRGFAMLLGIVLHGVLSFVILPIWPAQDIHQNNAAYGFVQHAIHGFRLPLFFLISGFFTAMMWRKRGSSGLIAHRAKRILLPLIIGTILIWPPIIGVGIWGGMAKQEGSKMQAEAGSSEIWTAAKKGDLVALQRGIDEGVDINKRDQMRISPMEWAAMFGRTNAINLFVEQGAKVNERNHDGSTPLHAAAFFGRVEVVKRLIALGADADIKNKNGENPLTTARSNEGLVEFLAGVIGMKIDKEEVLAGRRDTASYLEEHTGDRSVGNITSGDQGGEDHDKSVGTLGLIYMAGAFFPIFHHLWFLYYLLWLVGIFLVAVWVKGFFPRLRVPRWMIATPWCLFWLVPLTLLPQFFMTQGFGVDTAPGILPWPPKLIYYTIFFGFGAVCFGRTEFEEEAGRRWWLLLPLAVPVLLIGLRIFEAQDGETSSRVLLSLCAVVYAWLMIFGMIGFFRRYFGGENKRIRYLSDSSYWLYIAHLPLIMGLQVWVSNWDIPHFLKFLLVCILTFAILIVMYEYLVRYTPIGTALNGKRTRPGAGGQA